MAASVLITLACVYCPVPWSAAFFLIAVLVAIFACLAKRTAAAVLMVNIAAVLTAVAIFEGYIGIEQLRGDGTRMAGTITRKSPKFKDPDDALGYAPRRNVRVTAKKYYGDTLIYDVVYSIDGWGLRIEPPANLAGQHRCVVFFGDSHTFGEGLNDDQTLPYLVGLKTDGHYAIRNFAFSGYGPHQMLANLQSPLFDERLGCEPAHFFYLAIPEHIARVAGLDSWDLHGPRFTVDAKGEAVRAGNFDDPARIFGLKQPYWVQLALDKFFTWQRFFGRARDPNSTDLQLFLAVVRSSVHLAQRRYPNSDFYVLLWDGRIDERLAVIEKELRSAGISVRRVSEAIPDLTPHWTHYILSVQDPHPNVLQNELIANYLVHDVLTSDEAVTAAARIRH